MAKEEAKKPTGALAKDPTGKPPAKKPTANKNLPSQTSHGSWKYQGKWVNEQGYLVDNYGKQRPGQTKPFVPANKNPFGKPAEEDKKPEKKKPPTAQQKIEKADLSMGVTMGKEMQDYLKQMGQFDPRTFQQQYEPQFEQGMQRAYDTIYNEFNRRNEEEFARQNEQLQLSLAERGLDPNSPAYQGMTKQLAQQQNDARQAAQSQAWQAAQGYQQQGFQQATGTALLPGQVMEPMTNLYGMQYQGRLSQQQLQQKYEYDRKLQQLIGQQRQQEIAAQKKGGGGGGGGGGMDPFQRYMAEQIMAGYGPQQQQPNPWNTAAAGFAQGVGAGITNAALS